MPAFIPHPYPACTRRSPAKLSCSREKDPETDTYHMQQGDELSWEGFLEEGPERRALKVQQVLAR